MQPNDRIARALKLRDLHTFRAVVHHGSMSKAAREIALTPPAITKVIADLESLLGVKLLDRTPQGVTPTAYGEALLEGSVSLFDDLQQTVERIAFLADPTVGEVRIATADAWMGSLLPVVIDRLSRRYPRIVVHVTVANSFEEHLDALRERAIDVVMTRLPKDPDDDLDREVLFDDPPVVVASRNYPHLHGRNVKLAQLVDAVWCLPPEGNAISSHLRQVFRLHGLGPPNVAVSCISMQLQAAMVETGRYLTVLPNSYMRFRTDATTLKIVPVEVRLNAPPICIAMLKHRRVNPATKLFIETLRMVVKDMKLGKD